MLGNRGCLAVAQQEAGMLQASEYCVVGRYRDTLRGAALVDGNQDVLCRAGRGKRTGEKEDIVIDVKNLLASLLKCRMSATEGEQVLERGKGLLLLRRAAGGGEAARLWRCETAREIAAVVGVFSTLHGNLIAGVDLRHSAHGCQDGESKPQALYCGAALAHESNYVVIPQERYKPLRVRVKCVESEDIG